MLDLSISVISIPGLTVLTVKGEIDLCTSPDLRLALLRACAETPERLILDLRDVTFFDCSGIGALAAARARLPDSTSLYLVSTHPMLHKMFAITGLATAFPIHASLLLAMAA